MYKVFYSEKLRVSMVETYQLLQLFLKKIYEENI